MRILLFILFIPVVVAAQPFTWRQEYNTIPVIIDGYELPAGWTTGYSSTSPALIDIDADSDLDLILGSSNLNITDWQNAGSVIQHQFIFSLDGIEGIEEQWWSRPEFWDMDADGDLDLFSAKGVHPHIKVFENIGTNFDPLFELVSDTLRDYLGNRIYCQRVAMIDLDNDGDKDLLCGEQNGAIYHYENIGDSSQYSFELITWTFESIQVSLMASPEFCDLDSDGDLDLFVGDNFGRIWYYRNDEVGGQYNYALVSDYWMGIDAGDECIPEFADMDDDGDYDLFLGKNLDFDFYPQGDVHFLRNIGTPHEPQFEWENLMTLTMDFGWAGDYKFCDVNHDSLIDLYDAYHLLAWLKNTGTLTTPQFELMTYDVPGVNTAAAAGNEFGDLDNDGDADMTENRAWWGAIFIYENIGDTLNPAFAQIDSIQPGMGTGGHALGDLDADGDLDMLVSFEVSSVEQHIRYYENQGTPERYDFVLVNDDYMGSDDSPTGPSLIDFDFDGDLDLMAATSWEGTIWYYENQGTPQIPNFVLVTEDLLNGAFSAPGFQHELYDIDNDGDVDVFLGMSDGGCLFFRNTTGDTSAVQPRLTLDPAHGIQFSIGPNPANPITWISYNLPYPQKAEIVVYNLLGQKVATLASG
ncbi:VCBS repeat-containing protein, partial [bacterium]|nr:VCBS repeat-containing protein [bacterium]